MKQALVMHLKGRSVDRIQDLRTENPKPRSPLAPLEKGGMLEAPLKRGLGDLFRVSPSIPFHSSAF